MTGASRYRLAIWAGAIAGASLWGVNTQLGQILPYAECGSRFYPEILISLAAAGVSLICSVVSWRSAEGSGRHAQEVSDTGRFAARVSALLGLVFAFALLLQAAGALLLTGCER